MLLRPLSILTLSLLLLLMLLTMTVIASSPSTYTSQMLYIQVQDDDTRLMRWDIARNLHTRMTNIVDSESIARWSPDGAHIAYIRWEQHPQRDDGTVPNIYLLPRDGYDARRIIDVSDVWSGNNMLFNSDVRWSPDGRLIAYHFVLDNQMHVRVVDREGRSIRSFVDTGRNSLNIAQWSADSSALYLVDINNDNIVSFQLKLDGTALHEPHLLESPPRTGRYRIGVSEAGRDLYVMNRAEIWRYDFDARRSVVVASELPQESFVDVTWSPDGQHIAYVARHWDTRDVYVVVVDLVGNKVMQQSLDVDFTGVTYWNGIRISADLHYLYSFVVGRSGCLFDLVMSFTHCTTTNRQLSYWQTFHP